MLDKKINEILIKIEDAQSTIGQRLMAHLTDELATFSGEEGRHGLFAQRFFVG